MSTDANTPPTLVDRMNAVNVILTELAELRGIGVIGPDADQAFGRFVVAMEQLTNEVNAQSQPGA